MLVVVALVGGVTVRVVQVVDVVAMRRRCVSAVGAVHVVVGLRADVGLRDALVVVVVVIGVYVAVVQVVHVAVVLDRDVPAVGAVHVVMGFCRGVRLGAALIVMTVVDVVQVAVMDEIHVPDVHRGGVSALGAVDVLVSFVDLVQRVSHVVSLGSRLLTHSNMQSSAYGKCRIQNTDQVTTGHGAP